MTTYTLNFSGGPLDGTTTVVEEQDIAERRDADGNRTFVNLKVSSQYQMISIDMNTVEYLWYEQVE